MQYIAYVHFQFVLCSITYAQTLPNNTDTEMCTYLDGITDGEKPCKHSGIAINGQDPKHPGQPQQG